MLVLVLNCGSSSIKFQLVDAAQRRRLASGLISEVGSERARLALRRGDERLEQAVPEIDYEGGIARILEWVDGVGAPAAVGHRVVHGGEQFAASTRITPTVEAAIEACIPLAPLHNPANLAGIRNCQRLLTGVPQVAVFDTAFHQTLPENAYLYAVPYTLYTEHRLRRYGFHGTSHRYVAERAAERLGEGINLITLHLGNGASAAAIRAGRSVDTTMGMTPLEGLVMGTRSGDVDPSLPAWLHANLGMEPAAAERLLLKESGLLGLSQRTSDMREIEAGIKAGDEASERALAVYCYRIRKTIGAYLAVLGHVDGIVFTGGVGENSAQVRARVCRGLEGLGIRLDEQANDAGGPLISDPEGPVALLVIPTDEELMIALDTQRVLEEESR